MKLWLLEQNENSNWDTFDSCVVAAESREAASNIHPHGNWYSGRMAWASCPENVSVTLLGEAVAGIEEGVILGSFNAG